MYGVISVEMTTVDSSVPGITWDGNTTFRITILVHQNLYDEILQVICVHVWAKLGGGGMERAHTKHFVGVTVPDTL